LLNRYTVKSRIEGSNPSVSAIYLNKYLILISNFDDTITYQHLCQRRCVMVYWRKKGEPLSRAGSTRCKTGESALSLVGVQPCPNAGRYPGPGTASKSLVSMKLNTLDLIPSVPTKGLTWTPLATFPGKSS
jgi:hypothetical protein